MEKNYTLWVDADACPRPVKEIIFKSSFRLNITIVLVANSSMSFPVSPLISFVQVPSGPDCADMYICEHVTAGDIVVTADIPLAAAIVDKGAIGINPRGEVYTEENVHECLSMRNFMHELRGDEGAITGGPAPFDTRDKGAFANALNRLLTQKQKQ